MVYFFSVNNYKTIWKIGNKIVIFFKLFLLNQDSCVPDFLNIDFLYGKNLFSVFIKRPIAQTNYIRNSLVLRKISCKGETAVVKFLYFRR